MRDRGAATGHGGAEAALALAVKDWRRAARHTALEGLLSGAVQYTWRPAGDWDATTAEELDQWQGLVGGSKESEP